MSKGTKTEGEWFYIKDDLVEESGLFSSEADKFNAWVEAHAPIIIEEIAHHAGRHALFLDQYGENTRE